MTRMIVKYVAPRKVLVSQKYIRFTRSRAMPQAGPLVSPRSLVCITAIARHAGEGDTKPCKDLQGRELAMSQNTM
jgi:hypothetical protein